MFELVSLHVMVFVTLLTSAVGAFYVMKGKKIFELSNGARNLLYVGACCAMVFGFLGLTVCAETIMMTKWHFIAMPVLAVIGLFAFAHITVDLSDRLKIMRTVRAGKSEIIILAKLFIS